MPASPAQLAANRRNALSHGIFARNLVASQVEHPDDFESLRTALLHGLQPHGALDPSS